MVAQGNGSVGVKSEVAGSGGGEEDGRDGGGEGVNGAAGEKDNGHTEEMYSHSPMVSGNPGTLTSRYVCIFCHTDLVVRSDALVVWLSVAMPLWFGCP